MRAFHISRALRFPPPRLNTQAGSASTPSFVPTPAFKKPLFLLLPPPAATPQIAIKKVNEIFALARSGGGPVLHKGLKGLNFHYSVGSLSVQNRKLFW